MTGLRYKTRCTRAGKKSSKGLDKAGFRVEQACILFDNKGRVEQHGDRAEDSRSPLDIGNEQRAALVDCGVKSGAMSMLSRA